MTLAILRAMDSGIAILNSIYLRINILLIELLLLNPVSILILIVKYHQFPISSPSNILVGLPLRYLLLLLISNHLFPVLWRPVLLIVLMIGL